MSESNADQLVSESDLRLDRLASVGQIAAGIAHEVRNPLTAVKGFLQLLKHETPHKYLDYAYIELENAIETLQNLLHVSKPDLESEPFDSIDLSTELEALLYLFQERSYQVAIQKHFKDTNTRVYGKRNQIKKAFFNLIKNAFEAISNRGAICIKHYKFNGHLLISISDTGDGIPEEKINLLGTPFYTSKAEGTGMGLTQVFTTIYDHGGIIRVKSEVGVGTEFTVQLPIHEETDQEGEAPVNPLHVHNQQFSQYYTSRRTEFMELLKLQGKELFEIMKPTAFDPEYILESAHKLVQLLNERNEHGLIQHAQEHGRNWASHQLDLILKLEWIQVLRKTYWAFLHAYYTSGGQEKVTFFELERDVNDHLDTYQKHFASSYSVYKNQVLQAHREVIERLTVPVIPLSEQFAILPIVGSLDMPRVKKMQEQVFDRIHRLRIEQLVIDVSGVSSMDTTNAAHLLKIVNGIAIQGCKAILTGLRPEMTTTIVEQGFAIHERVVTRGSLQQALEDFYK
ncbi:ATP-binding protein [Paenibacillus koleovorans]|uniref:ATP-binding protein n=1 Tax=Paenibacillus koleovorans TaxID=121608 RepID=UPI0013E3C11A|nr:ATP-binding protein [Paenibacillus koleovorans]